MKFIGVDPGLKGAVAVLDEGGDVLEVVATPLLDEGGYDLDAIAAIFRRLADPSRTDRGLFVTVEELQAIPTFRTGKKGEPPVMMGGFKANHARGQALFWLGMLAAFRIPRESVLPKTWQRVMLAGIPGDTTKAQSIASARALWPETSLLRTARSRNDDDGFADALNLAEYGRRKSCGGAVFAAAMEA